MSTSRKYCPETIREIQGRRMSNAAGVHQSAKTRFVIRQQTIKEEIMSMVDEFYGVDYDADSDFWSAEPTEEELDEIESEDLPVDFDDEDYREDV
jgi:hypothetical protein